MTDNKQIKEMPICVNCVHAYVCEEYNLDRDILRKQCAYHNDHFLDIEQYKKKVCKETAEKIFKMLISKLDSNQFLSGKRIIMEVDVENLAKQFDVEIKE